MYPDIGSMMYPSSMACRIGYLWNDTGMRRPLGSSSSPGRPNRVMVSAFGVAVNAKNDTFGGIALSAWTRVKYSATASSSVMSPSPPASEGEPVLDGLSPSEAALSALFNAAALLPS